MQYKEDCLNFSKDESHKKVICDFKKSHWNTKKDKIYCPTFCPHYIDKKEVMEK